MIKFRISIRLYHCVYSVLKYEISQFGSWLPYCFMVGAYQPPNGTKSLKFGYWSWFV